jgi:hypothetical protein
LSSLLKTSGVAGAYSLSAFKFWVGDNELGSPCILSHYLLISLAFTGPFEFCLFFEFKLLIMLSNYYCFFSGSFWSLIRFVKWVYSYSWVCLVTLCFDYAEFPSYIYFCSWIFNFVSFCNFDILIIIS